MRQKIAALCCFLVFPYIVFSQEKHTISGTITDQKNGETLLGVSVFLKDTNLGTITNEYGFFSISAPKENYTLIISYLGYARQEKEIFLDQNTRLNFELEEENVSLDEVIISTEQTRTDIKKPQMSVNTLNAASIKKIPVVLGEVDILKSIQLLPGVTNSGEGASGFNVRGGAADQNLVLLDEAVLYNTSHLFGFFSVFNADAIKDIKLYKGGTPARYGGRISSILDARQKDGNTKEYHFNGGVGLISSRLLVEGPIKKEKGSFLLAGRTSYANVFLKLIDNPNRVGFYDFNAKFSYRINKNNKIFLSGYFGNDTFEIANALTNDYGNSTLNARWNHLFSDKLFSNLSLIYSKYNYVLGLDFVKFDWKSSIENLNAKYDLKYYLNNNLKLDFGFNGLLYNFNPGEIVPTDTDSFINPNQLDKKKAFEPAVYLSAEHKINKKLTLEYGLRYSQFYRLGGQSLNTYTNDLAVTYDPLLDIYERADPTGSQDFESGSTIKDFDGLEPRFSAAYQLNENSSIKGSYQRMNQYIHLISNTNSPTPLDVWAPSGKYIDPQISDQYGIGYFRNLKEDQYSIETELYYKTVQNRLDYIDGADIIANNAIEQELLVGESRAYGLEFLFRKNTGKLTGWLSYTLSKSEQRVPGRTPIETGINNGKWYNTPYDRTHDLSITASYELSKKWSFGANFAYQTGRPTTFPSAQYTFDEFVVPSFSSRYDKRLPSYHRLDISATWTPKQNTNRKWHGEWVFGIYNVYARKNAASINFYENAETGMNEARQLSIFGTLIPSATYNFKF